MHIEVFHDSLQSMGHLLRKIRGSFEDKSQDLISHELLFVRDFLNDWAFALIAGNDPRVFKAIDDLTSAVVLTPDTLSVRRKGEASNLIETMPVLTSFQKDFIVDRISPQDNSIFVGPLSTGALMATAVAATLKNAGYDTSWSPAYVPFNENDYPRTVILKTPELLRHIDKALITDDGAPTIYGIRQLDPLKTAGAVQFALSQLRES